jgi:hypothetical protein
MDLLTVVLHEMGHVLGLPDLPESESTHDLMAQRLSPGERRLLGPADPSSAGPTANPADSAEAELAPLEAPRAELQTIDMANLPAPGATDPAAVRMIGSEQEQPAAFGEIVIHADSHSSPVLDGGSATSALATTWISSLLGNIPLAVASASLAALPLSAGLRLTDPIFLTLLRTTTSPADVVLANPVREAIDHVLAGRLGALLHNVESPDSLNWEEIGGDLDCQEETSAALPLGHRAPREPLIHQSREPGAGPYEEADQAGLDRYFAEMAAAMDPSTPEE